MRKSVPASRQTRETHQSLFVKTNDRPTSSQSTFAQALEKQNRQQCSQPQILRQQNQSTEKSNIQKTYSFEKQQMDTIESGMDTERIQELARQAYAIIEGASQKVLVPSASAISTDFHNSFPAMVQSDSQHLIQENRQSDNSSANGRSSGRRMRSQRRKNCQSQGSVQTPRESADSQSFTQADQNSSSHLSQFEQNKSYQQYQELKKCSDHSLIQMNNGKGVNSADDFASMMLMRRKNSSHSNKSLNNISTAAQQPYLTNQANAQQTNQSAQEFIQNGQNFNNQQYQLQTVRRQEIYQQDDYDPNCDQSPPKMVACDNIQMFGTIEDSPAAQEGSIPELSDENHRKTSNSRCIHTSMVDQMPIKGDENETQPFQIISNNQNSLAEAKFDSQNASSSDDQIQSPPATQNQVQYYPVQTITRQKSCESRPSSKQSQNPSNSSKQNVRAMMDSIQEMNSSLERTSLGCHQFVSSYIPNSFARQVSINNVSASTPTINESKSLLANPNYKKTEISFTQSSQVDEKRQKVSEQVVQRPQTSPDYHNEQEQQSQSSYQSSEDSSSPNRFRVFQVQCLRPEESIPETLVHKSTSLANNSNSSDMEGLVQAQIQLNAKSTNQQIATMKHFDTQQKQESPARNYNDSINNQSSLQLQSPCKKQDYQQVYSQRQSRDIMQTSKEVLSQKSPEHGQKLYQLSQYDKYDVTLTSIEDFSPLKSQTDLFTRQHQHVVNQITTELNEEHQHELKSQKLFFEDQLTKIQKESEKKMKDLLTYAEIKLQSNLDQKEKENEDLKQAIQHDMTSQRQANIQQIDQVKQEYQKQLHSMQTDFQKQKLQLETQNDDLTTKLSQSNSQMSSNSQDLQQFRDQNQQKDLLIDKLKQDNQSMFSDLKLLAEKLQKSDLRAKQIQGQSDEQINQLEQHKKQFLALQKDKLEGDEQHYQQIDEMKQKHQNDQKSKSKDIDGLKYQIVQLEQQIRQEQINQAAKLREHLESHLHQLQDLRMQQQPQQPQIQQRRVLQDSDLNISQSQWALNNQQFNPNQNNCSEINGGQQNGRSLSPFQRHHSQVNIGQIEQQILQMSMSNHNQFAQQKQSQQNNNFVQQSPINNSNNVSPFRKKDVSPHPSDSQLNRQQSVGSPPLKSRQPRGLTPTQQHRQNNQNQNFTVTSPMKGRLDPNLNEYARKQKMFQQQQAQSQQYVSEYHLKNSHQSSIHHTNSLQTAQQPILQNGNSGASQEFDLATAIQEMGPQELQKVKARKEQEYAKMPIIMQGKGVGLRKKKEELEYELDLIDKTISKREFAIEGEKSNLTRHRSSKRQSGSNTAGVR